METKDTICALATPHGMGAIALIRVSGGDTFKIADLIFKPLKSGLLLSEAPTHTIHFGNIVSGDEIIDEVLVNVYRNPHSYTGEECPKPSVSARFVEGRMDFAVLGEEHKVDALECGL